MSTKRKADTDSFPINEVVTAAKSKSPTISSKNINCKQHKPIKVVVSKLHVNKREPTYVDLPTIGLQKHANAKDADLWFVSK